SRMVHPRSIRSTVLGAAVALVAVGCGPAVISTANRSPAPVQPHVLPSRRRRGGIHKIRHIVMIVQENRSFDSYFGTYPGADGLPMRHGIPTVCVPDPQIGRCARPWHDPHIINAGGPHSALASRKDLDGGQMDGFIR